MDMEIKNDNKINTKTELEIVIENINKKSKWYIWDLDKRQYWGQCQSGYVSDKSLAGIYDYDTGLQCLKRSNAVKLECAMIKYGDWSGAFHFFSN